MTDSFFWDFHKWAMQVYSCSACIVRDKKKLVGVYAEHPEYPADVIDYAFFMANLAKKELQKRPDREITSPPRCGVITFRYGPKTVVPARYDELNAEISRPICDEGFAYIVTTVLKGRRVLRLCLMNGNTTDEDVFAAIQRLDEIAHEIEKEYIG